MYLARTLVRVLLQDCMRDVNKGGFSDLNLLNINFLLKYFWTRHTMFFKSKKRPMVDLVVRIFRTFFPFFLGRQYLRGVFLITLSVNASILSAILFDHHGHHETLFSPISPQFLIQHSLSFPNLS